MTAAIIVGGIALTFIVLVALGAAKMAKKGDRQ